MGRDLFEKQVFEDIRKMFHGRNTIAWIDQEFVKLLDTIDNVFRVPEEWQLY